MPRPPKYNSDTERIAARKAQRRKYASTCKINRSAQNHAAYKRKNGRLGSAILPEVPNILVRLADQPILDSPLFRTAFENPGLFVPTPLQRDKLLATNADGITDSDIEILSACYLKLEQEAEDTRLHRFKQGETFYLRRDIESEMRRTLAEWREHRAAFSGDCSDKEIKVARLHLTWMSRMVKHLRDELYILGSIHRSKEYINYIMARRVHV